MQQGQNVVFSSDSNNPDISSITIKGESYNVYAKKENVHQLAKTNLLTVTRCFNQRVKAFIKQIVLGKNNPMSVEFYNY